MAEMKREIIKPNRRIEELDMLYKRVYEDHTIGKLSGKRLQSMSGDYEAEYQARKQQEYIGA